MTAEARTATALPPVSVIVPVHGNRGELALALRALAQQDYAGPVEVIVVDNGDNHDLPADGDGVTVVAEATPTSYAARNSGTAAASGAILAFTDADCRPGPSWLSRGVETLLAQDAPSFVGGRIEVELAGAGPTGAALWDRRHGLRQDLYVLRDGYAATANLLVARDVFAAVGPFDGGLPSGGDHDWGQRATGAGVRPVYGDDVVVFHPARSSLAEIQRKLLRLHRGRAAIEAAHGEPTFTMRGLVQRVVPHSRSVVRHARLLRADGCSLREQLRYVLVAHWLQYYSLVAWLRAAREPSARRR